MDERYTFLSKGNLHWGDVYLGKAKNSSVVVATFIYPQASEKKTEGIKEIAEHFAGESKDAAMNALTEWLDSTFGSGTYDMHMVKFD
jgi:hypothetical protein